MKYTSIICAALFVLLGAGCGQKAVEQSIEQSIENQSGMEADVNIDDNSMTIQDEESGASMVAGEEVDFPSDFPSDIPRYGNGTLKMATQNLGANQSGYMMVSPDQVSDIAAWFKRELAGDWKLMNTMTIQGNSIMAFERDADEGTVMLSVSVSPDEDDGSGASIVVTRTQE